MAFIPRKIQPTPMAALRRLQTAAPLRCPIASSKTPRPPRTLSGDLSETLTRPTRSPFHDLPLRFLHFHRTITSTVTGNFSDRRRAQYSTVASLRRLPKASIKTLGPLRSLSSSANPPRSLLFTGIKQLVSNVNELLRGNDMEELVKKEQKRIEELLVKRGMPKGSHPEYWVTYGTTQLLLWMEIPPAYDIQDLIGKIVGQFGVKANVIVGTGSDIRLRAWEDDIAYGLRIIPRANRKGLGSDQDSSAKTNKKEGKFAIVLRRRYDSLDKLQMRFWKEGSFSPIELDAFIDVLQIAGGKSEQKAEFERKQRNEILPAETPSSIVDLEGLVKEEQKRMEELLKKKGMQKGSYPLYRVFVKDQKLMLGIQIPSTCDYQEMFWNIARQFGVKGELSGGGQGYDIKLHAWENGDACGLRISPLENKKQPGSDQGPIVETDKEKGNFHVLFSRTRNSPVETEMRFVKEGSFSPRELDAFIDVLLVAGGKLGRKAESERKQIEEASQNSISSLQEMGVKVYGFGAGKENSITDTFSWGSIAGYDQQKREIEDNILLALQSPRIYDDVAHKTRSEFDSNRPRAILFEGPPGTGKTSFARAIANQARVPLLYVPLDIIMAKYYSDECKSLLKEVFSLADKLPTGAIIFLDEIDYSASCRISSAALSKIDEFELDKKQDKKVIVIGVTNKKEELMSLNPALMSRFDTTIYFGHPDERNRQQIAAKYAAHLTEPELLELAQVTEGMTGKDIKEVCQHAERSWASKIIRGEAGKDDDDDERKCLPPLQDYIGSGMNRRESLLRALQRY